MNARRMLQLELPWACCASCRPPPPEIRAASDAFLRWLDVGDLPPPHVGNARLWDCMLQGMLQARAERLLLRAPP